MPPHPHIGSDQTVANFGASHKQHMAPGRSSGHFFHLRARVCPLPTTAPRRRSPGAQATYGQPQRGVLPFQVSRTICGQAPDQRDDGDRYALPRRHRRSQAATAPAVVAAWQPVWAHLPPMASVCCAPDASTLQRTARSTLPNACKLRNSTSAIEAANTPVDINSKTPIS